LSPAVPLIISIGFSDATCRKEPAGKNVETIARRGHPKTREMDFMWIVIIALGRPYTFIVLAPFERLSAHLRLS
jgi:hypothetical protein